MDSNKKGVTAHNGIMPLLMRQSPAFGVVLLAAGRGARMGLRPKCLLQRDAKPLIHWQLQTLLNEDALSFAHHIATVVVVLGHHARHILPWIDDLPVTKVCQVGLDHSMDDSIALGVRALSDLNVAGQRHLKNNLDGVIICPTDLPLLGAADYQEILTAFEQRPPKTHLLFPSVAGVPGHPVIFDRVVAEAILGEKSALSPRQWRQQNPTQVFEWVTDNAHYIWDVDSVEDINTLAAQTGVKLQPAATD